MGETFEKKYQLGDESVAGTAVAASAMWRGPMGGGIVDLGVPQTVPEDVGYTATARTVIPKYEAQIPFPATNATFEQLPYVFEAGIATETPTQDGAGTDYIYNYLLPSNAENTLRTYTIESGDNTQAEEAEYCFCTDFSISGDGGQALQVQSNWTGRQVSSASFTALSRQAVTDILFGQHTLFIDDNSTYPATTQLTAILHSFNLNVVTGWQPKYLGDGNLYFTTINFDKEAFSVELDLTFSYVANAYTQKGEMRNETPKSIRLNFTGPTVGTPGTTYSNKHLIIDLVGKWMNFSELGAVAGNTTVTGTFKAGHERAQDNGPGGFTVVNELSALV